MTYTVNLQSVKSVDRARFAKTLRIARKNRIRAIHKSSETNEFGHVRTYAVNGRWEANTLAAISNELSLCSWQS